MQHHEHGQPSGWVKPQRSKTLPELRELITEKRRELLALEKEAASLAEDAKLQAIATARNIMRAHELTIDDLGLSGQRGRW